MGEYYRERGIWRTFLHTSLVLGRIVLKMEDQIFCEINLTDWSSGKNIDSRKQISKVKKEDIENAPNYFDGWFYKRQALKRLEQGHVLLAVTANNKLIYMNWLELKNIHLRDINLSFSIPDTTAFDAYQYTVLEYRNKGIASWAHCRVIEHLQQLGYKRVFGQVSPERKIGHFVATRIGYKDYQTISFRRFFWFLKCYCVKDCDTGRKKIFWRIRKTDQEIWKAFSKIEEG